ncbi:MAG: hypothetical protein ACTSQJ_06065 [Promethearchaeota archaeon]
MIELKLNYEQLVYSIAKELRDITDLNELESCKEARELLKLPKEFYRVLKPKVRGILEKYAFGKIE